MQHPSTGSIAARVSSANRPSFLWRLLRTTLLIALGVILVMMFLENRLIFFPSRYPEGEWQPPGLPIEDAWFDASDGVRLHGWYVARSQPLAYVLFCHGNGGNITHRIDVLRAMYDRVGASVLIFDYRGYGRSAGSPSEAGVLADARAARDWLARRAKIDPREVVLMGESLGGAVAVDLAAADGARALILENSFNNLPDVAAYHFPWLPVRWFMRSRFDSASKIGRYHGPLLQSHGDPDHIVPHRFGVRLFEAANEPKRFIRLPGFDHNDGRPMTYYDEVRKVLAGK